MSALQGETPLDMAVRSKNGYIVKSMKKEQHDRGVATQSGFINKLSSSKVGNYWNYTLMFALMCEDKYFFLQISVQTRKLHFSCLKTFTMFGFNVCKFNQTASLHNLI